jgi:hypothetical protein
MALEIQGDITMASIPITEGKIGFADNDKELR